MSNVTQPFGGLNHDRLGGQNRHPEDAFVGQTMVASQDDAPDAPIEITAGQKMLSAISGSLFTSMLSAFLPCNSLKKACMLTLAK